MEIKMDIENMHPFCLPFSLCHESASGLADSKEAKIAGDTEKYCSGNNNNSTSLNNNNNNFERTRSRSKGALSPLDDLFDSSNLSPPLSSRSVFQEECLIESSVFAGDSSSFHALHLDLDMDIDSVREGASPRLANFEHDDWFANSNPSPHDCLVFSPTGSITNSAATTTRASKSHSSIEHNDSQVFHIVDPIAIKSSPTLAQLNLNSNDDPTDALWGDGASSRAASCVAAGAMISNSTSIISANLHSNPDLHLHPTCTHLHNSCLGDHYSLCNQQQHTHLASDYSTHTGASHSPMCHHLYHSNHHHQLEHVGGQSTCLAVAPFTKKQELYRPDLIANNVGFCVYQHQTRNPSMAPLSNQVQQQQQQQQRHINCQCPARAGETGTIGKGHSKADCQQSTQVNRVQQPRSVSPAPLVTSSSSPLSSSGAQRAPSDGRISENKLKENIEYLTVLLSNGSNKLEKPQQNQQQQSPTISSTIVKSYTTLAQSLSTEPKLLLQSSNAQLHNNNNNNYYQASSTPNTHQQNGLTVNGNARPWLSTNEVNQLNQHQQQWFKSSPVESSISAADSTAENNQISTTQSPMCNSNFSPSQNNASLMDPTLTSRPGEMKVLSSLLSSNMGRLAPMGELGSFMTGPQICANWHGGNSQPSVQSIAQPMSHIQAHSPVTGAYPMSHQSASLQQANSIPPTGRPITLTPLLSNNVMIGQRQSPQRQSPKPKASKVPTFAQPASPSASSTTSSSGNTEIASSASSSSLAASAAPSKRQKASAPLAKASDRFGRPSSLSTECSLSSHDEGFSSQVDQDDCMNSMRDDSEDDSDVDSDDESFYGDYTNNDLIGASISDNPDCKWALSMGRTRRNGQRRFFWQYNVQSKGPKGARIASADGCENPFVLPEASDPVFSNDCQIEGVKHSGKARRGDGNDLTPNPRKLLMIGLELKKLSKIINDLAPVTDLPANARNKTRKEKNKLASRACRLKKKAQHEANKIKLFGLQHEHQQVVMAIHNVRKVLRESLAASLDSNQQNPMSSKVKDIFDQCSTSVAGKTSDYVNSVLEKVVSGFIDGGLQS